MTLIYFFGALFLFALGLVFGSWLTSSSWVEMILRKACTKEDQDNTPIYVNGRFYYVIEEKHFVEDYGRRIEILSSPEEKQSEQAISES